MNWLQVSIEVDPDAVESVAELFSRYAPGGVAIEEPMIPGKDGGATHILGARVLVHAYLPSDGGELAKKESIEEGLWHLNAIWPLGELKTTTVAEADWANAWKDHFHTLRLGRRIVIKPTWREWEPAADDLIIELDPGMAFGTGLHATTQMCLETMEDTEFAGRDVLDLGTGSGILAITAAKLGARSVLAVDNDSVAVRTAAENVALNALQATIDVRLGSLPLPEPRSFDVVLANIIARVLTDLAADLKRATKPGGMVVASGIIADRLAGVEEAFKAAGFTWRELRLGDWVTLVATSQES